MFEKLKTTLGIDKGFLNTIGRDEESIKALEKEVKRTKAAEECPPECRIPEVAEQLKSLMDECPKYRKG